VKALATIGIQPERIAWLEGRLADLERSEYAPVPLVDGDVLTSLGLRPGPIFKRILNEVYDAQLEGRVSNREGAVAMALEIARKQM